MRTGVLWAKQTQENEALEGQRLVCLRPSKEQGQKWQGRWLNDWACKAFFSQDTAV